MIKKYQILKETIKEIIQNSELDIGVVYFILKDIFQEIESLYYIQINKELIEDAQQKQDEGSNLDLNKESIVNNPDE